jgi:hypothetical protein
MAIITDKTKVEVVSSGQIVHSAIRYQSSSQTVATGTTIDLSDLDDTPAHWFCSVQMFDVGGVQVVGGAGTFAVLVGTWVNGALEAPPTATINASAPETIDWSGPTNRVQIILTGAITGVTWRIRLDAKRS